MTLERDSRVAHIKCRNYFKLSVVTYPLASGLDVFVVALREVFRPKGADRCGRGASLGNPTTDYVGRVIRGRVSDRQS